MSARLCNSHIDNPLFLEAELGCINRNSPVANPLVTAICVSRGIDDDLRLVAKMLGKQEGLWLAEYLEYNWEGFPTSPKLFDLR